MAYSILSLRSPSKSRLGRAAGVSPVFNPPARPGFAPVAPPSYDQQISQFASSNPAPQFAPLMVDSSGAGGGGTTSRPIGGSATPAAAGFSNATSPAFQNQTPQLPGGGQVTTGGVTVDYTSDPILQQAQAAYDAQVAQAQADAIGQEKTALIRYGDPKLVAQVLGGDAGDTADAASKNSFSTVAELGRWNSRALGNVDTTANRSNLYFSSTRARDRGLQEEDYTRQQARTGNQLQDLLAGVARGLLQQKQASMASLLGSAESAYNRQLQAALQQQYLAAMTAANTPAATPVTPTSPAGATGASPTSFDTGNPRLDAALTSSAGAFDSNTGATSPYIDAALAAGGWYVDPNLVDPNLVNPNIVIPPDSGGRRGGV